MPKHETIDHWTSTTGGHFRLISSRPRELVAATGFTGASQLFCGPVGFPLQSVMFHPGDVRFSQDHWHPLYYIP